MSEESVEPQVESSPESLADSAPQAGAGEQLDAAIEEAKEAGDKKAEKELLKLKREIELKVNGKVIKKSFNSEEDLIKELQIAELNKSGHQNYKEAQKHFKNLVDALNDPERCWDALRELNPNIDDAYTKRIMKDYEEMERTSQMTEEQKELEKLRKENSDKERRIKEWESKQVEEKNKREEEEALQKFVKEMDEELSKTKLPKSDAIRSRIAQIIDVAEAKGYKDYPVSAAVKIAEHQYMEEIKSIINSLPPAERTKLLSPEKLKKEKDEKLESISKKPSKIEPKAPAVESVKEEPKKKVAGIRNLDLEKYLNK